MVCSLYTKNEQNTNDLFSPYRLGKIELGNRMVMAPMTRNRAAAGAIPQAMNVEYYRQRASAGLIITEASQVSAEGVGYPGTPGIYTEDQVAGWRKVTDAVHSEGGRIFIQLWFCGRISHPDLLPDNQLPVAPSAIKPEGEIMTYEGLKPYVVPRALQIEDITRIIDQYKHAAKMAKKAGFDGIEIHAANGYLIDQFLRDATNQRTDQYGGTPRNRMRFLDEVIDAVLESWEGDQVGVRLSPENRFNSISDSDPEHHFQYFINTLNARGLAYIHLLEGDMLGGESQVDYRALRDTFNGTYIANNGYDLVRAKNALLLGNTDLIAFGVPFFANPDLVNRFRNGLPLNQPDKSTFYGGDETGYTDYPVAS